MADFYEDLIAGSPVVLPNIGEWTSYTPSGSWATNTTYSGRYKRDGSDILLKVGVLLTNTAPVGSLTFTAAQLLNGLGLTIATSAYPGYGTVAGTNYRVSVGTWSGVDVGAADYSGTCFYDFNTGSLSLQYDGGTTRVTNGVPFAWSIQDNLELEIRLAIAEWTGSANVAYGAGLATSVKSGLTPATATLGSLRLHTAAGYGSTNTCIRRMTTTVLSQGTGFTYSQSATLGDAVTITESGVYSFTYSEMFSGAENFGLSKNTSQPSTSISSIAAADRLVMVATPGVNLTSSVGWCGYLIAGDVVRMHASGTTSGVTPAVSNFVVQRLA